MIHTADTHVPVLRRRSVVLGCLGACALTPPGALALPVKSLVLTRISDGPEQGRLQAALRTCYDKLGIHLDFVSMPAERALIESNAGRVDGEIARRGNLVASYEDLRQVNVPLYINTNSVFVYGVGKTPPASLSQLSRLDRVGIVGGWKGAEEATMGWKNVVRVISYASALQMLKLGRLDAFLGRSEDSLYTLQQQKQEATDYPRAVVLRYPLFHYLNRKHEDLLPAVTRELQRMQGKRGAVVDTWVPAP